MSGMELLLRAAASAGPPSYSHPSMPPKKRMNLACGDSGLGHTDAPTANSERTATEAWPASPEGVGGQSGFVSVPNEPGRVEQPAWIGPDEWQNILATAKAKSKANHVATFTTGSNEAAKAKEGEAKDVKASKSKSGRGRKRKPAPLVKDVDGNDIGMGYFSMNPVTIPEDSPASSPVLSQPAVEERTTPVSLPPLSLHNANAEEPLIGTARAIPRPVEEILYQAYLAGLHRPSVDRLSS